MKLTEHQQFVLDILNRGGVIEDIGGFYRLKGGIDQPHIDKSIRFETWARLLSEGYIQPRGDMNHYRAVKP